MQTTPCTPNNIPPVLCRPHELISEALRPTIVAGLRPNRAAVNGLGIWSIGKPQWLRSIARGYVNAYNAQVSK